MSGSVTFDTKAAVAQHVEQTNYASVTYIGASVQVTIGSNTITGNDVSLAKIEEDGLPTFMQWVVMASGGFRSGIVGGLPIHYLTLALPVAPSRYPDMSLVTDPGAFQQGLHDSPDKATIMIKNIPNPGFRTPGIDLIAPGLALSARITAVK